MTAQALGLAALGFSSVYREGFETVLFLQALTLEAGVLAVLPGVALGLAATFAVGGLTILLERKLPHRKMLIATGRPHDLGARDPRRDHGPDTPGRRLAARDADRRRTPAVLGRDLARHRPHLAGRPRGRSALHRLRGGQLPRRGARARTASAKSAHLCRGHHSLTTAAGEAARSERIHHVCRLALAAGCAASC